MISAMLGTTTTPTTIPILPGGTTTYRQSSTTTSGGLTVIQSGAVISSEIDTSHEVSIALTRGLRRGASVSPPTSSIGAKEESCGPP